MSSNEELIRAGYRYALSITGNQQDAEDLVHDAWLRVYGKYGPFNNKFLLFRAVHNLFVDHFRKERGFSFEAIDDHPELAADEEEEMDLPVTKEEVRSALATLRPEERQAIYLNYFEGYSAATIARINNMPRSTVLSLLQRGKHKMRRALKTLIFVKNRKIQIKER